MARKIKRKMIRKELRNIGCLARFFTSKVSLKRYSRIRKAQIRLFQGRNLSKKHLEYKEIYINEHLRICVYEPLKRSDNVVGLLWLHGGGYLNGMPELESEYFKQYILETNCIVFVPDYTKSLEKPYPQALYDAYDTLKYMRDNAISYGINLNQLFIGGVSAGGGLAAALSLYARDKGEIAIAFQMPLYPMLDDRMITDSSKSNDAPVWTSKANEFAWKRYLDKLYGSNDVPVYAAPSRATDYTRLPPTLTFVGGIDLFKDETLNYVDNLKKVGIPTKHTVFEGCFHGFEAAAPWKKISKEAFKFSLDGFVYATENYFKEQPKIKIERGNNYVLSLERNKI